MAKHIVILATVVALALAACASDPNAEAGTVATTVPTPASVTAAPTTTVPATTTTVPPTTTTTTTLPPKDPVVLGFAGDTSFTHSLHARDPLGDIVAELSAPDARFVNLETTVAESDVGRRVN